MTLNSIILLKRNNRPQGAWVAQLVKYKTLAQVTISPFLSLSRSLASMLTAQSLEPVSDSLSPSLSAPPLLMFSLKKKKNIKNF